MAVLLPLTGRAAAENTTAEPGPADSPPPAQPEVWLCAGDRIMELLEPGAEWPFVGQHLAGIKLYVGQLSGNRRQTREEVIERLRPLVRLVRAHNFQVAVELGGCLDFSPMDETAGEWSARHELAALANFYAAGGRVDYLDLDGPIRRLLHPENRRDGRRFDSIDQAADELVDALKLHRAAHPETRYWLLTNFPNWGWRGDVSYHARGPQRQDYGDYDQVVRIVLDKLRAAEIPLDGVTVDNPYDYLVGAHFSVNLPDPKSVNWLARVRSYEDFAREQGLTFNLIVNSQRGGQESDERFFRETLRMVDAYQRAGGRPTRWFVQSWYPHPKQMLPEAAPHSMTAVVKAVIERVRGEASQPAATAGTGDPRSARPPRLELEGLAAPEPGRFGVLGFRIRAPWMRGAIEQRFPETIHSSLGLHFIDHQRHDMPPLSMLTPFPAWEKDESTGEISYAHKDQSGLVFSGRARPYEDEIVLEYRIRNETGQTLHNISVQMCTNLGPSPDFDPKEDVTRTFTWVDGRWTSWADTTPNLARAGRHPWILMQVQKADYKGPRENPDGWWVADQIADHGIAARVTRDGEHLAAVRWDSAPMLMSNSRIPCLHAGPTGGVSLEPGQEVVWRGTIYLMRNDPDQLLRRFRAAREEPDTSDRLEDEK
jgi:hypothetical protein